jgi:hypothetical protein
MEELDSKHTQEIEQLSGELRTFKKANSDLEAKS